MVASLYGLRDFEVQYWTGSAWAAIPGGTVTGNNLVWRQFLFAAISTTKIRVNVSGTADGVWTRIAEVEAWSGGGSATPDFSLAAIQNSLTLTQGETGTSTMTIAALNGFSGSVGLAVSGCPSGATCTITTPVTPAPIATANLSVVTTAGISSGQYSLTITGTGGAQTHSTTVELTVNAAGGLTNMALPSNGGVAVASSTAGGFSTPTGT